NSFYSSPLRIKNGIGLISGALPSWDKWVTKSITRINIHLFFFLWRWWWFDGSCCNWRWRLSNFFFGFVTTSNHARQRKAYRNIKGGTKTHPPAFVYAYV